MDSNGLIYYIISGEKTTSKAAEKNCLQNNVKLLEIGQT
jgi:hypothetical protein